MFVCPPPADKTIIADHDEKLRAARKLFLTTGKTATAPFPHASPNKKGRRRAGLFRDTNGPYQYLEAAGPPQPKR
jgi:hypothetical protein